MEREGWVKNQKKLSSKSFLPNLLIYIFQAYCSHVGPVSYVLYLELDEHSPNPERYILKKLLHQSIDTLTTYHQILLDVTIDCD